MFMAVYKLQYYRLNKLRSKVSKFLTKITKSMLRNKGVNGTDVMRFRRNIYNTPQLVY